MTEKLLSDKEVLRLAGPDTKVVLYPDVAKYNDIDELFGHHNKIALLYVNEENPTSITGHWVALLRTNRNGKQIYEVSDSYGKMIDGHLDAFPKNYRNSLGQSKNFLTRLLYAKLKENKNSEVHYNEVGLQKTNPNIATCGRWCGTRLRFSDIPLEHWQKSFRNLKNNGHDIDKVIVNISNKLLN